MLLQQADTVGVTTRGSRAARHDKGRVRQPDRTFRVKDWLDRFWRNKPCELLVPTYLPHATNRQRTAKRANPDLVGFTNQAESFNVLGRANTLRLADGKPVREDAEIGSSIVKGDVAR